jgi:hypothetical protein
VTTETSAADIDVGALQEDCPNLGARLAIRSILADGDRSRIGTRLRRLSTPVEERSAGAPATNGPTRSPT